MEDTELLEQLKTLFPDQDTDLLCAYLVQHDYDLTETIDDLLTQQPRESPLSSDFADCLPDDFLSIGSSDSSEKADRELAELLQAQEWQHAAPLLHLDKEQDSSRKVRNCSPPSSSDEEYEVIRFERKDNLI